MKDYSAFEAADFVLDEKFLDWVKYPTLEKDLFWRNWLIENPHKKEEVKEARGIILAILSENQHLPLEHQREKLWKKIEKEVEEPAKSPTTTVTDVLKIAASVLVFLIVGSGAYYYFISSQAPGLLLAPSETADNTNTLDKRFNNTAKPLTILLSDGSTVVLQPNSSIQYPYTFQQDVREVHLEGEAFFEIAKDIQRPFLVYANDLVTKVLGTSFSVRAYDSEPNVIVEVRSGKVSVFPQVKEAKKADVENPRKEGLVLTPNQQAVYTKEDSKLVKSLFENPTLLSTPEKQYFEFTDARMKDVFKAIEESYGVQIVYDEEAMVNCFLNASLTNESLQEKLRLICRATNASYEIMDTHIIVYGKGCDD